MQAERKIDRRAFLLGTAAALVAGPALAVIRRRSVRGLAAPLEIIDDAWGISHIRAASIPDAFFGQGYVVARDRLFQIDLAHRRELGRLAEAFGPRFLEHDAAARLFHYRGDLDAELGGVPADVLACGRAYVAGINARIDEVTADPALLPPEYGILGIAPLRWDVRELVLTRDVVSNAEDEVRRAQLAALGLLDLDALVAPLRPAGTLRVPDGLDAAAVGLPDLGVLRLGRLPFGPDPAERDAGSNAWTIAPSRSATGRAILANDPHLGIGGFSPRYVAHLSAPGLDVIGGGAPGLPGIMQGHTNRFAFGRTNFHIDQGDLFVLNLHPDDPERYRHDGGWRRFEQVEEVIAVKGATDRSVTLRYSVHGPVIAHQPDRRRATALATIAMQPGASGAFAMIAINLAKDWAGLRKAFALHPSPTNFHYADVRGDTAWQAIGYVPVRKRGDGLLPLPGDGRYDWTGRRDFTALPGEYNPRKGWFASANQNNLPADWPRDRVPAYSFREPYRYDRIAAVLAAQPRHTLADSVALQHDTLSLPAQQLLALLPRAPSPAATPAVALLHRWDARLEADSAAAALFELTWRALERRMLAAVVPAAAQALVTAIAPSALLSRLPGHLALLDAALADGWRAASDRLGPDPARWRYGTLHQVRLRHPLAAIPAIAAAFPPIEGEGSGGDSYTPMARWIGGDWRVTGGASYLQVIDVGVWDKSLVALLPGQSIDPRSPHYRDGYRPWATGRMQPLLFSRAAIDAHAAARTLLAPG